MNFKNLSLFNKLIYSTIPVFFITSLVAYFVYLQNAQKDMDSEKAILMVDYVDSADLEMVKMSEALRGYLLNPSDESEYKRKKEADNAYAEYAKKISELVQDSPEILALNKKMEAFDASDLDKIEEKVAELIKAHNPEALTYYAKTYIPARKYQMENFKSLKEAVHEKSNAVLKAVDARRVKNLAKSLILLLVSSWIGTAVMLWISSKFIRKISSISQSLGQYSLALNQSSTEIAEISQNLSTTSSEQAAALQETTASAEEMSSMVHKSLENAKNAATSSNASKDTATQGTVVVEKMIQSMNEIKTSNQSIMEQVNQSNSQLGDIIKLIQEIGNKTKVINDIVFQTKLLSFNASVEAARAGEHGKGFAVVAEEVGNLAQMSGNAAKEITAMLADSTQKVESIVSDTKSKVERIIAEGKEKIEGGTQVAQQCGEVLNEIVCNVQNVSQMANEISVACQEQAQGVQEINKAMSQLDRVSQQNAATSQSSAEAAAAVSEKSQSLKSAIDELVFAVEGRSKLEYSQNNLVEFSENNDRVASKRAA